MPVVTTEDFYSEGVGAYDKKHALENQPQGFIDVLDRFVELVGGGRVLDAGCGTGRDVNYFTENGLDAVGIDITEEMIEYARENKKGEYRKMDIRDLEFPDRSFGGIHANASLFFQPREEWEGILEEFYRVTEKGGILHLCIKLGEGTYNQGEGETKVKTWLASNEDVEELLKETGYKVLDTKRVSAHSVFDFGNYFCRK